MSLELDMRAVVNRFGSGLEPDVFWWAHAGFFGPPAIPTLQGELMDWERASFQVVDENDQTRPF